MVSKIVKIIDVFRVHNEINILNTKIRELESCVSRFEKDMKHYRDLAIKSQRELNDCKIRRKNLKEMMNS